MCKCKQNIDLSEFKFEFDDGIEGVTCNNLNNFLKALSSLSDFHWIVMVDEVKFIRNRYDLRELKLQTPNVDFHFAINPNGEWCDKPFDPVFPEEKNTIIRKLDCPHRNSIEIAILLLHLNALIESDPHRIAAMSISTKDNKPIHQTCISSGAKPLWVTVNDQLSDQGILDAIKYEIGSCIEDVTPLYHNATEGVKDWCEKQNWKYISYERMTGSEASAIVLYKVYSLTQYIKEYYSRARLRLIIVHG